MSCVTSRIGDVPLAPAPAAPGPPGPPWSARPPSRTARPSAAAPGRRPGRGRWRPAAACRRTAATGTCPRAGQSNRGERGVGGLPARGAAALGAAQRQRHVVPDGQPRVQRPAVSWKTTASRSGTCCTGSPRSTTCPAVGVVSPAMQRSRVDLPQPDGPDDADELALGDAQAHSLDGHVGGLAAAVGPGQVRYLKHVIPVSCRCARRARAVRPRRAAR